MVGLFDSGSGGLNTARRVKDLADDVDLVYLIDRKNAPYGTKSEEDLISIAEANIQRLADMGAETVLIACCTASTVHARLGRKYREISVPIIEKAAKAAQKATRSRRIGVIATKRTTDSHAFSAALSSCFVSELAIGELVGLIDGGLSDSTATNEDKARIENMLRPVLTANIDTLVLGCTHFPSLKKTIMDIASGYGVRRLIDTADVGAELLVKEARKIKK